MLTDPFKYYLIVKSILSDESNRDRFDEWYKSDHMPKALLQLGAESGRRYWSDSDPLVHYAIYLFTEIDRPRRVKAISDGVGGILTHEFNVTWPGVVRTREVIVSA